MLQVLSTYFRACYQADYRALSLLNFYSARVEHSLVLESAQLLQGKLFDFPVSTTWGKKVDQQLAIYSKEKALYCCSFFMIGEMVIAGKKQNVAAPLFLHPVELKEENEIYYVSIQSEGGFVNPSILQAASEIQPGLLENLNQKLPKGFIQFDQIFTIEKVLKEILPNLDVSLIDQYPEIWNEKEIKKFIKEREDNNSFTSSLLIGFAQ